MCGIISAIADRDVILTLLLGLERLEYRGYDSAGIAVRDRTGRLQRIRSVGKVALLSDLINQVSLQGNTGIAHTRWATHGMPSERNAHPHMSGERVAVVHNGIIENHRELREELESEGFLFNSETDTEVIAHLLARELENRNDLVEAVQSTTSNLIGAYALAVLSPDEPDRIVVARFGSPLVIGISQEENFVASDITALLHVTEDFTFLEDGDIAEIRRDGVAVFDSAGRTVKRPIRRSKVKGPIADKGPHRHYMFKEILEQPAVIAETLEGRIHKGRLLEESFGHSVGRLLDRTENIHVVACGTSYHAGLVARYWLEEIGVPCSVEVASEYRYRDVCIPRGSLFVTLSQSGETADTLAALAKAIESDYLGTLCVCNVAESSLVRGSDATLMTRAGPEIGVASTKAFTTQLVVFRLLTLALARRRGLDSSQERSLVEELHALPRQVEVALGLSEAIEKMAVEFVDKEHALFLGRGTFFPVAMEGALKMKEISYIHAEAYPAGELKHGPLALVDANMPVVCALPNDPLLKKVLSNLQEVRARNGELFLFSDQAVKIELDRYRKLTLSDICPSTAPIVYTVPLQLLAYHVAVLRGTDVDQPRNLAKSVTVE